MIRKISVLMAHITVMAVIAVSVGVLELNPLAAQEADPTASRSFSPVSVAPGGRVTVTITAKRHGSFAEVAETLPDGFTYLFSSLPDDQVTSVGQTVTLSLVGATSPITFTYTVTASRVEGGHSFTGVFSGVDADFDPFSGVQVGGDSSVAVGPPAGPNASRSFSPEPVDAEGELTVTIIAEGHGSFADVAETLPDGFTYLFSSLPDDQVTSVGQTVTLSLVGATSPITFTYTVTASRVEGGHSFTGVFSGVDADLDPFSGVQVGGDSSVAVGPPAGPNASRSFSPEPVDAEGELTVTIIAEGHGSFADVAETLPDGFTYLFSSLPDDQVTSVGQTVTLSLVGATSPTTFTYTVTASRVEGGHSFTGVFSGVDADFDPFSGVQVGGDSSVAVGPPAGPNASRSFSPEPVDAEGELTVTIIAEGHGSFANVAETLPDGFTYLFSSLPDDQVTSVGQTVTLSLVGATSPITFTYTVTASRVEGGHSFTGVFSGVDADFDPFSGVQVGGDSSVAVGPPAGPNASRSFSPEPVDAEGELTVTIIAEGHGSFADVAETLPDGFTYLFSSLPDDQVTSVGQTVTLSLVGATSPTTFTYTVTASRVEGGHSFTGVFSGVDADFDPFSGVQVGEDSSVTVRAPAVATPSTPAPTTPPRRRSRGGGGGGGGGGAATPTLPSAPTVAPTPTPAPTVAPTAMPAPTVATHGDAGTHGSTHADADADSCAAGGAAAGTHCGPAGHPLASRRRADGPGGAPGGAGR